MDRLIDVTDGFSAVSYHSAGPTSPPRIDCKGSSGLPDLTPKFRPSSLGQVCIRVVLVIVTASSGTVTSPVKLMLPAIQLEKKTQHTSRLQYGNA